MTTPSVPFNPFATTNAAGSFGVSSVGYIQGVAVDNPAALQFLNAGLLASTETLPMWGGVAVMSQIPIQGNFIGGIQRADNYADLSGFSVYNQNYANLSSPQSPAPVTLVGGQVNWYPLGCGALIPLAINATLAASLQNGTTLNNYQVSWDFTNQLIVAFNTTALAVKIIAIDTANSLGVTYTSATNTCVFNTPGATAIALCQI
jgi:hypothetical protein